MEVTGKQIKEFVDKFEPEELMTMCAAISNNIAEASEAFYEVINKAAKTYPELYALLEFNVTLICTEKVHGKFVDIHIGGNKCQDA